MRMAGTEIGWRSTKGGIDGLRSTKGSIDGLMPLSYRWRITLEHRLLLTISAVHGRHINVRRWVKGMMI